MAAGKVYIVGIGDDGVEGMTSHARRLVESADMLLGPKFSDGLLPSEVSSRFIEVAHLEEIVEPHRIGWYQAGGGTCIRRPTLLWRSEVCLLKTREGQI